MADSTTQRKKGAPSKREQALANDLSVAAHDLREAQDYAETYMARVAVNNAIVAYEKWMIGRVGRPVGDVTPFPKSVQLARGERRYRRKVASPKQWQAIRAAKCSRECRICGNGPSPVTGGVTLESHHLIPRDRHGDDTADNIIGLCPSCHAGVELRQPHHCRLMLTRLSDAEYAYAVGKLGEGGLERLYGVEYDRGGGRS